MKSLVLIAFLSLCCLGVKAQLNKSQSEVMQLMADDNDWTFTKSGRANDGVLYLLYQLKKRETPEDYGTTKAFYFMNDTCSLIRLIFANSKLNTVIKDMNKKFTSMGNSFWVDSAEKTTYEIKLVEGSSFFTINERPQPKY